MLLSSLLEITAINIINRKTEVMTVMSNIIIRYLMTDLYMQYFSLIIPTVFQVKKDGVTVHSFGNQKYKNVAALGNFKAGDVITLYSNVEKEKSGSGKVFVYQANEELLRQGIEKLSKGGIAVSDYSDTEIKGTFTAENDSVFYTSIPYDGGWKVYIDGEEAEVTPLKNAVVCVPVTAGSHEIRFKYCPPGFAAGAAITVGSVIVFASIWILEKKYRKKVKTLNCETEKSDAES